MRKFTIMLLPIAAVLAVVLLLGGGLRTAHAGVLGADCLDLGEVLCISLDPEFDTNTVGDDHTVTATVTLDGNPLKGVTAGIVVFDGPNADAANSIMGSTDASGQVSLTYTGDGGPGTDDIGAVACLLIDGQAGAPGALGAEPVDPCVLVLGPILGFCLGDPVGCLDILTGTGKESCLTSEILVCDVATKDWVEPTPTPTPPPTATPTPTPTVLAAVQTPTPTPTPVVLAAALPVTGGEPPDSGSDVLAWLAAIAGGIAAMTAGGVWLAYGRRRVR